MKEHKLLDLREGFDRRVMDKRTRIVHGSYVLSGKYFQEENTACGVDTLLTDEWKRLSNTELVTCLLCLARM